MVLGVDAAALKLWLTADALPRVSDADPAALAEYIIELLDTLDLSELDSSSTHSATADSLREFFDTHTDAFVTQLFTFLRRHRAQQQPPHSQSQQQQDRAEDRSGAQPRNGRSRSPSDERRRSRSRERSWEREREHERGRRRRSVDREEEEDDMRDSGRGGRRDAADDRNGSRRGSGTILIRDDRYGIKAVETRDRERGRGEYRDGRDRGRQPQQQQQRWQQQGQRGHSDAGAASHAAPRSPLIIQRPFVPAPAAEPPARIARTVRLPPTNPFDTTASAAQATSTQVSLPAVVRRVGNHTVELKTRTAPPTPPPPPPAAAPAAAVPSLLLHNAPRYVLSMRMLTDHFGMFGSVQGIEIDHSQSSAVIRFGTAEEVSRALMGRPLHPDISMSISYADSAPAPAQHRAAVEEQQQQQTAADGEADGEMDNGDEEQTAAAAQPPAVAPAVAQMAVGKHTLTIRARVTSPPPLEPPSPLAAPQLPAPGSALYAAEQIRLRKENSQQQPQQQAAGGAEGSKEQRLSAMKLSLLQQQVDQSELLLNRCLAVMAASPPGSAAYLEAQRKCLDVEMSIEESRRKLSEERGRIVRMSLAAANAAAGSQLAAAH